MAASSLATLRGRPLLEHALTAAVEGPADAIVVVLGADAEEIERGVELGDATVVRCANWECGPGASLRAGLAALDPDITAALVTLGDEPFLPPAAAWRLLAARRHGITALRATYSGRPGHPVLIERSLFATLAATPDARPMALLGEAGMESVECGDLGDPGDVDTPEQLRWLEDLRVTEQPPRNSAAGTSSS
ncbi:MAG: nucleotidyltransferase family protein [Actinobacteria bacterium]|nr:nucleotidyltransferase family protein [Actinomycetota bacterium]